MRARRRTVGRLAAAGLALYVAIHAQPSQAFGFADVIVKAEQLAAKGYDKPDDELPRELLELSYDQYRDIRFKPERSLWRDAKLPFEVQFFHPGLYFRYPVRINLVSNGQARTLPFNSNNFDYGRLNPDLEPAKFPENMGFAGLRVHYNLNSPKYKDEVLVFQGASYFRALGKDQRYGLSARGLAIDTAELSGEEFPAFTEFWIEQPTAKSKELTIYALLDSKRATGAYRFVLKPGAETAMDVRARLYLRDGVAKLGVAPLTSMYLFGENQAARTEDYRPEVHDSDGLLMKADNGEWLWRPLVNPRRLMVTAFGFINPRGFGLMQRDRDFRHYEDLEARYELRPSVWVEPKGDWGPGRIELVMIPTPDETNDNIVAYWLPDQLPKPKEPVDFSYTLRWQKNTETKPPFARVVQTRSGHGFVKTPDDSIRMMVDFESDALKKLPPDAPIEPGVWVGENGQLLERQLFKNEVTGGWRLSIRLRRESPDKPVEMRANLRDAKGPISEVWSYILPPG